MAMTGDLRPSYTHIAKFVRDLKDDIQPLFSQVLLTRDAVFNETQAKAERDNPKTNQFSPEDFYFDEDTTACICPAGHFLVAHVNAPSNNGYEGQRFVGTHAPTARVNYAASVCATRKEQSCAK
jgi:hypothetical protein